MKTRKRAAASIEQMEAAEIHLDLGTPCEMFPGGDDLPIFSGTPINVHVEPFKDEPHDTQTKFAECPICFDTHSVKVNGQQRACWCNGSQEQQVRNELLSTTSPRLARVRHNAPAAYPETHSDIETVLKEAALIEPLTAHILDVGVTSLTTVELLTILLNEQTPILASRVLAHFASLSHIYRASHSELLHIKGMTPKRATTLQCALALANRRLTDAPGEEKPMIKSPQDAAEIFGEQMYGLDQEEMHILLMNTKNRVLQQVTVYRGSVHTTVVRITELFKEAVRISAAAVIVAHNHPSGDPTPSPEDVAVTQEIVKAGKILDIDVLDHLVIGSHHKFVSLKERGLGFG